MPRLEALRRGKKIKIPYFTLKLIHPTPEAETSLVWFSTSDSRSLPPANNIKTCNYDQEKHTIESLHRKTSGKLHIKKTHCNL